LGVSALFDWSMRLGEGTGCAMAIPVLKSAVALLNDMATFDNAGISKSDQL
jgi:nicotinate-nucleotide--dimethylbenzimidazole phosphoribosyltransferase